MVHRFEVALFTTAFFAETESTEIVFGGVILNMRSMWLIARVRSGLGWQVSCDIMDWMFETGHKRLLTIHLVPGCVIYTLFSMFG